MSSNGPWNVVRAQHYKQERPPYGTNACFVLANRHYHRDPIVVVKVHIRQDGSPFTYSGSVSLVPKDGDWEPEIPEENRFSSFKIDGNGTWSWVTTEGGDVDYESTFRIVEGSGEKKYTGISGGGRLCVTFRDSEPESRSGTCVFENMNEVGASLM
ncbi:MAG: hypothetical protein Q9166_007089 [cf. Caloplaca sp. 2 TL-2023]